MVQTSPHIDPFVKDLVLLDVAGVALLTLLINASTTETADTADTSNEGARRRYNKVHQEWNAGHAEKHAVEEYNTSHKPQG